MSDEFYRHRQRFHFPFPPRSLLWIAYLHQSRWLAGIPPGNIYVPWSGSKQLMHILDRISALDTGRSWAYQITPVRVGDEIPFRQNLVAHILPSDHSVPAVSYLICEVRKKLKPEFRHLSGRDIAELKRSGVEITTEVQLPLIAYLGDTRSIPLDAHPLLKQCKVLICECTFILPEHRVRAKRTMHLHLEMLPSILENVESEHVVLTHFSRRYTPELIRQKVFSYLPPEETFSDSTVYLIRDSVLFSPCPFHVEMCCQECPDRC